MNENISYQQRVEMFQAGAGEDGCGTDAPPGGCSVGRVPLRERVINQH